MIQGILLLSGFLMLLFMVPGLAGGLPAVVEHLSRIDPAKVEVPTLEGCMNWISYVFLFGFGAAIYPRPSNASTPADLPGCSSGPWL